MSKRLPAPAAVPFLLLLLAGSFPATRMAGQSSPQPGPSFEVASIRASVIDAAGGEGSTRSQIQTAPDSLTLRNIDLDEMVEWAYTLQHNQLADPGGLHNHRFDIRARATTPVSEKTLRLMLQNLLATRFDLKVHREQKKTSVYELIVAKDGPRLPPDKTGKLPVSYPRETFPRVIEGSFVFTNTSMPEFAQQLTELRGIDLPVLDRTGIHGVYDITLKSAAAAMLDPSGPSLLTLIHEQLGLKLIAAKDPIEIVVIDHAEEPSGN
jgi:uncharacterized protein (TIGR03435 family)